MKQVNFSHSGGFPLEQETLERLQTAYRSELFGALKSHFSIKTDTDYIIAPATITKKGWVIIHHQKTPTDEGVLYSVLEGSPTPYLRTTRKGTNLIYGNGTSQNAYFDYEAQYISPEDYANRPVSPQNDATLMEAYFELKNFSDVKDLQKIEEIFKATDDKINAIEADINLINESYLPLNGSKAMKGDLDLGTHRLSRLEVKESYEANVRVADFRLGSIDRKGLLHPTEPLGRALVDSSNNSNTSLTVNYMADWDNTHIGGKLYFDNLNTTSINGSLLVLDGSNQVIKSNTLIDSLLNRITALENKPATAVPLGMIAIWGKAAPFPEGWQEYVPLRGKMPVGFNSIETEFNTIDKTGGSKSSNISAVLPATGYGYSQNTSSGTSGKLIISTGNREDGENLESIAIVSTTPNINFSVNTLNPYRVVQFIEYTGRPKDTTAPTKPNLTFVNVGTSTLYLNWTASNDEFGVTKYLVYKNGTFLGETSGNNFSYYVSGLTAGTSYNFYVIATDAEGNLSERSDNGDIRTADAAIAPAKPLNIQAYSEGQGQIGVEWEASIGANSSVKYQLFRKTAGGTYRIITEIFTTYYMDNGSPGTTYYYKVQAVDAQGNESGFIGEVWATTDPASSGGGGGCFDVESLVTMASGQSKKLKNIVVGDKLQGFSFPNEIDESEGDYMSWSGKLNEGAKAEVTVVNKRTSIQPNYYEIKTAENTIKVTGEHPLLISEDGENLQWIRTKNIVQSMLLIDKNGKTKAIESIVFKDEPVEVALLDVENVDNYVISGIVAHNIKEEQLP